MIKYLIISLAWAGSLYYATGEAYTTGYTQGRVEGRQRALMAPESLETCTKWWFDGSESRAKQAMNQYCDRRMK